jgi:arylsulfatase A-like enzyme
VVLNIDLAPTFAEFGQIPIPPGVDGRSLRRILFNTESNWRGAGLIEFWGLGSFSGLVSQNWKYVKPLDGSQIEELYDLTVDREELASVALAPDHADVLFELRAMLADLVPPP